MGPTRTRQIAEVKPPSAVGSTGVREALGNSGVGNPPLFMGEPMSNEDIKFLPLFSLAILNDAVDVLGLLSQPYETILDLAVAILISLLLRKVDIWAFAIIILDLIPGLDLMPIWFLYILYRYLEYREKKVIERKEKVVRVPVE